MSRSNAFSLAAAALLPLAVSPAVHAQRLTELEGIELRGTARVVEFGAATCNVVEERETATSYEQKKTSHGQPIDIWQLDFSVYNGSGRSLDHVIAVYQIEAEDLPCTNWSLSAAANYTEPVQWGGAAGQIQRSGTPTAPAETLTTTSYVWVFHDDQPRFDSWQLNYDFAPAAASPAAAPTQTGTPVPPNPGSSIPPAQDFTLRMMAPGEICDPERGGPCWLELADRPGCHIWRTDRFETVTWSGECAGGYAQGAGTQLLRADLDGDAHYQRSEDGTLVDGRKHGRWAEEEEFRLSRTNVRRTTSEGPYVNGERNGIWRHRNVRRDIVTEGRYVDGRRQGEWVSRHSSGTVTDQGRYVDGQRQGRWVSRQTDGTPWEEGEYVDGQKHGFWTEFHDFDGNVSYSEYRYVNGSREGLQFRWLWTEYSDRAVQERYVVGETSPVTELTCLRSDGTLTAFMKTYNSVAVTEIDLDEDQATRATCEGLLSKPKPEFGS